jgi:uncharacterized surface protein with fasciclin (FAS1) repeats
MFLKRSASMKARSFVGIVLAAALGVSLPAPAPAVEGASIYDTLASRDELGVMFVIVTEAKQVTALKAPGQFTLFAPTDEAFKTLDAAAIKAIASDKEVVRKLLDAHLVKGKHTTDGPTKFDGKDLPTLRGGLLKVEKLNDGFRVGGAKLVTTDIQCSNGVIHVIDAVLPLAK